MSEPRIEVFIPRRDSDLDQRGTLLPGSGIVGTHLHDDRVLIDFEGGTTAANIRTYGDRVMLAAGRHTSKYPTIARMIVPARDLTEVGEWDGTAVHVYPAAVPMLGEWLGISATGALLDPAELRRSDR